MINMYPAYCLGEWIANALPLESAYAFAAFVADCYYLTAKKERAALGKMLDIVHSDRRLSDKERRMMSREVFRNFAKYLADFFRFRSVDSRFVKERVSIIGTENIDKALSAGKGAILLSAHMGNWELGAKCVSDAGYPMHAVVLTHATKEVNDFFKAKRQLGSVVPVEIGISLRACYKTLKNNGLLALMGDRDFTGTGPVLRLFGRETRLPKGPGVFSVKLGAAIVPSFMVRGPDDKYKIVFEKPIYPVITGDEDRDVISAIERYIPVLEKYIKEYSTQWYTFKDIWSDR